MPGGPAGWDAYALDDSHAQTQHDRAQVVCRRSRAAQSKVGLEIHQRFERVVHSLHRAEGTMPRPRWCQPSTGAEKASRRRTCVALWPAPLSEKPLREVCSSCTQGQQRARLNKARSGQQAPRARRDGWAPFAGRQRSAAPATTRTQRGNRHSTTRTGRTTLASLDTELSALSKDTGEGEVQMSMLCRPLCPRANRFG